MSNFHSDSLVPVLYDELRRLAHHALSAERGNHTFQTTALVHEAYLRLLGKDSVKWDNRGHFFGAAAIAMRRILVDRARSRKTLKRGGDRKRLSFDVLEVADDATDPAVMLSLDEALVCLEARDPRKARIVMLRFFAGMTINETAEALEIAPTTVKEEWQFARAWLYTRIQGADVDETG